MDDIRLLGEADRGSLLDLLAADPVANLFLLGMLEEQGVGGSEHAHAFYAHPGVGPVGAVVLVSRSGLWVPHAQGAALVRKLGSGLRSLPMLSSIGDRAIVDALWIAHGGPARRPRLARVQKLMQLTADDMGPWIAPQVRLAGEEDLLPVVEASALMQRDDLGLDPRSIDIIGHQRRCLERLHAGRTFVLYDGPRLVFKVDVGARSRFGAQLEGVYTAAETRRKGVATKALGQVCRTLLSGLPRVTLGVDVANGAAIGLYRKLGFSQAGEQRLLIAE